MGRGAAPGVLLYWLSSISLLSNRQTDTRETLHRRGVTGARRAHTKDRRQDVERHRDEADDRGSQHDVEHLLLILVAGWPEVNQDDADAVEGVVQQRGDQRGGDQPDDACTEDGNRVVVDGWPEAKQGDINDVDEQEQQNGKPGDSVEQP